MQKLSRSMGSTVAVLTLNNQAKCLCFRRFFCCALGDILAQIGGLAVRHFAAFSAVKGLGFLMFNRHLRLSCYEEVQKL
jgi:hypothetical protein